MGTKRLPGYETTGNYHGVLPKLKLKSTSSPQMIFSPSTGLVHLVHYLYTNANSNSEGGGGGAINVKNSERG